MMTRHSRVGFYCVLFSVVMTGVVSPPSLGDNLTFTTNCNNIWQDCCPCGPELQINWPRPCRAGLCPDAPGIGDVVTVTQDCTVGVAPTYPDATAGTLNHTGGTLTIGGILNVGSGGAGFSSQVVWLGGTLARASAENTFLSVNDNMIISGGSEKLLGANIGRPMGGVTLYNASTITWDGPGNLVVGVAPGGATLSLLYNESFAVFDQKNDANLSTTQQFGFGRVTNQGTIKKSAGIGTSTWNIDLENFGLFSVQSGNLTLTGPGQATGEFRVVEGSTLTFGTVPGFEFKNGISFTDDGDAVLVDTGSNYGVLVHEDIVLNRFRVTNSGAIGFRSDPGPGHIRVSELLELDGADVDVPMTIQPGARLVQNGPNQSTVDDLFVEGEVDISQGVLASGDRTITVESGGVVEIRDGAGLKTGGLVHPPIQNNGTIQKSSGAGTASVGADFSEKFYNNVGGLIHVAVGTLDFGLLNILNEGGDFQIDAGTMLRAPGSFGGMFEHNGGTLRGGGSLLVRRLNNNGGTVAPGASAGKLTIIGDVPSGRPGDYLQGANGTLAIEVGGLNANDHDLLAVAGMAALGGDLEVTLIDGFEPEDGDQITFLTAANVAGTFADVNGTNLPNGVTIEVSYFVGQVNLKFNVEPTGNNNNNNNSGNQNNNNSGNGNSNQNNNNSNSNDNDNSNTNTNVNVNQNNNDNQNDNENPAPGPAPDCGGGACGGGMATAAPLLVVGLISALRRRRRPRVR